MRSGAILAKRMLRVDQAQRLTSSSLALLFSVSPLYASVSSSLMIAMTLLIALVSQACL